MLGFCIANAFQDPKLQYLMLTAAKVASDLHILNKLLVSGMRSSRAWLWFLYHLGQEVIDALQKPS